MIARATPPDPSRAPRRRVSPARRLARAACAAVLLAPLACFAAGPPVWPQDPPANVPPGLTLLEVPVSAAESLTEAHVTDELSALLLGEAMGSDAPAFAPERREQILARRVVTGMSVREVVFCFRGTPSRERLQGPPGGRTLLWEPRDVSLGRYWVRFDEHGKAADAGRY